MRKRILAVAMALGVMFGSMSAASAHTIQDNHFCGQTSHGYQYDSPVWRHTNRLVTVAGGGCGNDYQILYSYFFESADCGCWVYAHNHYDYDL